jgi:predicted Zn-ribbon and HTH transcriptional regulator
VPRACDPAVARVREAGGPIDSASYACDCGYLFRAPVSTTVRCPHCGADQAW